MQYQYQNKFLTQNIQNSFQIQLNLNKLSFLPFHSFKKSPLLTGMYDPTRYRYFLKPQKMSQLKVQFYRFTAICQSQKNNVMGFSTNTGESNSKTKNNTNDKVLQKQLNGKTQKTAVHTQTNQILQAFNPPESDLDHLSKTQLLTFLHRLSPSFGLNLESRFRLVLYPVSISSCSSSLLTPQSSPGSYLDHQLFKQCPKYLYSCTEAITLIDRLMINVQIQKQYRRIYSQFDQEGKGRVSLWNLGKGIGKVGTEGRRQRDKQRETRDSKERDGKEGREVRESKCKIGEKQFENIFNQLDIDQDGLISFEDFLCAMISK